MPDSKTMSDPVQEIRERHRRHYDPYIEDQAQDDRSALFDHIDRLEGALKLGGHLRPDGSLCGYTATGTVCNKCGTTDTAFPIVSKLKAANQRLRRHLVRRWTTTSRQALERLLRVNGEAGSVEVNPDGSACFQYFVAQAGPFDEKTPVVVLGPKEIDAILAEGGEG
jgi:hypothetical protein